MKKDLVISWLDDILCKWAKKFAYYMKGDDSSFKLCDKMKWLPQYIYHLRRGFIMKKFGISWDEVILWLFSLSTVLTLSTSSQFKIY
jgi:protein transport protein SEC23